MLPSVVGPGSTFWLVPGGGGDYVMRLVPGYAGPGSPRLPARVV